MCPFEAYQGWLDGFPADGPADLLAGAHPGAASSARGSPDRGGGHPDGGCRARTSGATVVTTRYAPEPEYLPSISRLWVSRAPPQLVDLSLDVACDLGRSCGAVSLRLTLCGRALCGFWSQ
jgi:hypothetical protein